MTVSANPPEASDLTAYREGARLLREGRYLEALAYLQVAATTGEDRPLEHYALGFTLFKLGKPEEARIEFRRFLMMAPEENDYTRIASRILADISAAEERAAASPEPEPEPEPEPAQADLAALRAGFDEGIQALRDREWDQAAQVFTNLAKRFPNSEEVWNNLGLACFRQGAVDRAIEAYGRALALAPRYAPALVNLGRAELLRGQRLALAAFQEAVAADAENVDAHVNLGFLHQQMGKPHLAAKHWAKAREIAPTDDRIPA